MEVTDQIGIDIGMTHSRVSIFKDGRPQVLPNELASNLTPSYVAYTEKLCHVGDRAQEQEPKNVSSTVHGVRRLLGYRFTDPSVQQYYAKIPYKFINIGGRPRIKVEYQREPKYVVPEEIWTLLLKRMVEIGANALGEKVKKAVITVPSEFTCCQCRAVKDAAAIVGIDSELIKETTAAALAYVYEMKSEFRNQERNLLVYNMGGGFTTATVVSVKDQHISVLSTAEDMLLGGDDFDNVLADYCCRRFMEKHNKDVSQNHHAMCLLRRTSEKAKRELSFSIQTTIEVEDICPGTDFEDAITRKEFEDQCEELFQRAIIPARKLFEGTDLSIHQIDDIILVGGSTRMPRIQQEFRSWFNLKSVNLSMNPFETAVLGAAVHMSRRVTVQDVTPSPCELPLRLDCEKFYLKTNDVLEIKEALETYGRHRAEDTDRILVKDAKDMLLGCEAKLLTKLESEDLSECEKTGYNYLLDILRKWLPSNENAKLSDFESILETFNKGVVKIKRGTGPTKQNLDVVPNSSHFSEVQDIRGYSSPKVGMIPFAIGIDLGTTYSCVGVVKDGRVKIIDNARGFRTTASCVAFTEYERLVGDVAKEQGIKNFRNTVFDVKRLTGRKFNEEAVQKDIKYWPFKVVNADGRCKIQVEEKRVTKTYTPEELSAMVLTNIKETAEAYLKQEVKEAVITVPAYFNDSQRQATKDAAKIAGLNVLRIMNEPTAAGIAYALVEKTREQKNILIYDLGGGTFDVTVMVIQNGNFNVKSTSGDTHLGGEDFNSCLVEYCAADFKKKSDIDLSNNFKALRRLRKACEKAKRLLSEQVCATIEVDSLADYTDFSLDITRSRFEEICFHLFKKTLESVIKALDDAQMDKSKIDEIILVGGSTRIPRIKRLVMEYFKGKKLYNTVHPDHAVAYGAAVQAAILAGNKSALVRNVVIKDVTPLTLGLSTYSGKFSRVIGRNSALPAKGTVVHCTVWDNQKESCFCIYQGEKERYMENDYLGEFTLTGLREAPKGEVQFDVLFEVDENGILDVKITERGTNNSGTIEITKNAGYLTSEEIAQMIKNEEKNVQDSRVQKLIAETRNAMENI